MEYTRVTVIGTRRKADLVLPDDHPVDSLLPEIATLLDEPKTGGAPLTLTTLLGDRVDGAVALAEQGLDHGSILRLVSLDDAPQPPDVAEVTEAVADAVVTHGGRWSSRLTAITVAVVVAVFAVVTGSLLPGAGAVTIGIVCTLAAALVGAVLARRDATAGRDALLGFSMGSAVPLGFRLAELLKAEALPTLVVGTAIGWALIWIVAVVVLELGARRRGILAGAVVAIATTAVVIVTALTDPELTVVAAVTGILAAALLGTASSVALATSGVVRLDDAATDGETVRRNDIDAAITQAFATQTAFIFALVPPLALSILLLSGSGTWEAGVAAALAVFAAARSRLFPIAIARLALIAAVVVPMSLWLVSTGDIAEGWRSTIGALVCIVLLVAATTRPSAPARARLRRFLSTIEMLAVIALVPLLLGVLGVFDDLLGAFS